MNTLQRVFCLYPTASQMVSKFHSFLYSLFIIFRYSNSLLINLTLNLFFSHLLFTFYHLICRIVCNTFLIIFLFTSISLNNPFYIYTKVWTKPDTSQVLKYLLKLFKNGRENTGCKIVIKKEKSILHLLGEEGWGFLWISFLFGRFHEQHDFLIETRTSGPRNPL